MVIGRVYIVHACIISFYYISYYLCLLLESLGEEQAFPVEEVVKHQI